MRHRTRRAGGAALLAVAIAATAARAEEAPLAVLRNATGAASASANATASATILDRPAILRAADVTEWRADAPPSPRWPVDARATRRSCPVCVADCPQLVIDLP